MMMKLLVQKKKNDDDEILAKYDNIFLEFYFDKCIWKEKEFNNEISGFCCITK